MKITPRLRNLCLMGQGFSWFMIICMAGIAIGLIAHEQWLVEGLSNLEGGLPSDPAPELLHAAAAVLALPAVLALWAVWLLARLFGLIRSGRFLAQSVGPVLNRIGILALASAFGGVLARTAAILILSLQNPSGQKMLSIGLSSGDFFAVLLALLFFLFAQVQAEMVRLEEDNRSIL